MKSLSFKSLSGSAIAGAVLSLVALLFIGHLSTPTSGGPLGILLVFLLIYVFFTSLFLILSGVVSVLLVNVFGRRAIRPRRRYYVSSVMGFLPVLYLTLLSMGGASVWGVGLVLLFVGLMLFYVMRRS